MCCRKKQVADENEPAKLYKDYSERGCTDICCCLLFIIFWLGMVVVAATGLSNGDPNRLLYGTDYNGKTCSDPNLRIYYPKITEDILAFATSGSVNPLDIKLFGVCVPSCPGIGDVICTTEGKTALVGIQADEPTWSNARVVAEVQSLPAYLRWPTKANTVKGNCWITPLPTAEYLFRCMWVRNVNQTVVNICMKPDHLRGLNLGEAAKSSDPEVRDQVKACIVRRQVSTTSREGAAQNNPVLDQMLGIAERFGRYVSDARKAVAPILICGGIMALIVGFIWLLIVQTCAWFIVWTTVWSCLLFLIGCTLYAWFKAGSLDAVVAAGQDAFNSATDSNLQVERPASLATAEEDTRTRWKYLAWFMTAFTFIIFVLVMYFRSKINTAIGIIKEAARAIKSMPILMTFPFCSVLLLVILTIYWCLIAAFVYSQGTITTADLQTASNSLTASVSGKTLLCPISNVTGLPDNSTGCASLTSGSSFQGSNLRNYLLMYHFFGLLWTINFITGLFIVMISTAVAYWYFKRVRGSNKLRMPVITGIKTAFRYHMGTVAFGSLIIAIIQFLRAVLAYLDKKSKKAQQSNMAIKFLFKCIACCLWCFEKCIKFVSKNAYIITSIQGKSFIGAAVKAVTLMLTEAATFVVVNVISEFIFLLGKLAIMASSGLLVFVWLDNDPRFQAGSVDELESLWVPVMLTLLLAYFVATAFMDVYDLAIDTLLLCFLLDVKREGAGKSNANAVYASKSLLKTVNKSGLITVEDVMAERTVGGSSKRLSVNEGADAAVAVDAGAGAGSGSGSASAGAAVMP